MKKIIPTLNAREKKDEEKGARKEFIRENAGGVFSSVQRVRDR